MGRERNTRAARLTLIALLVLGMASASHAAPPAPVQPPVQAGAQPPQPLALLDFQIDGNTRLSQEALETAVYPFLGPERSVADVEAARAALEQAYHQAGYLTVYVDVPPQQVVEGRVRLQVTEGQVERLRVVGSHYHSLQVIAAQVNELQAGKVPNFTTMQQQLAGVNHSDLAVEPVLRPGQRPGTVEADLQVQDQLPLHGHVEINDRYSAHTAHARVNAAIRYDNLWQAGHSLGLDLSTAPGHADQTRVWHASYSMPWGASSLAFYALHSSSAVAAVGDVNVLGAGNVWGARWYSPGLKSGDWYHTLSGGLDLKDFKESVRLGADGSAGGYDTPIRYLPWQLQWQATDLGDHAGDGRTSASLAANFALRGLGSHDTDFENKRYKARASYLYLRGDAQATRNLGRGVDLSLRASGQLSSQPLISNEAFSAGGADSVRGYAEAERVGDQGLNLSAQVQSPAVATGLRLIAFFDWALLRTLDPLPQQTDRFALASAGLGLRLSAAYGLSASLDLAQALLDDAQGRKRLRLHSRLAVDF